MLAVNIWKVKTELTEMKNKSQRLMCIWEMCLSSRDLIFSKYNHSNWFLYFDRNHVTINDINFLKRWSRKSYMMFVSLNTVTPSTAIHNWLRTDSSPVTTLSVNDEILKRNRFITYERTYSTLLNHASQGASPFNNGLHLHTCNDTQDFPLPWA